METLRLADLKALLECPRRYRLQQALGWSRLPSLKARTLHALRTATLAYWSGEIDRGRDLMARYWSMWPADMDRGEEAAAKRGAQLLTRWFRSHQVRSALSDGVLATDEVVSVSYHGVTVEAYLDLRLLKDGVEERVLFFLDPPTAPEGSLLINHVWHHTMLLGQKSDILLYNFAENCYSRLETINPALYSQALRAARELLASGAKHPTFSGCDGCNVSRRCLHDEIVL